MKNSGQIFSFILLQSRIFNICIDKTEFLMSSLLVIKLRVLNLDEWTGASQG